MFSTKARIAGAVLGGLLTLGSKNTEAAEPATSSPGIDKWRGSSDLSALAGKVVRLQFTLRQSALYTWQFR